MFKKISRLRHFGIFRDFSWGNDPPELSRFNLIYGWNGSGKTTLSRVFAACEKRTIDFRQYPKKGEFEIKYDKALSIDNSNVQSTTEQVRVFNRDFIEENVSFDKENSSKPIVYIGKISVTSKDKLNALKNKIPLLSERQNSAVSVREALEGKRDGFMKSSALTVKNTLGEFSVPDKYRSYNKRRVEEKIAEIGIGNFRTLSDEDFRNKRDFIKGECPKRAQEFAESRFAFSYSLSSLGNFSDLCDHISGTLGREVVADVIDRFKHDEKLNQWAQRGFELHREKKEQSKCLFCQNELSDGFLESLSRHFSNDYENLQSSINSLIEGLKRLQLNKIEGNSDHIYADLRSGYESHRGDLNRIVDAFDAWKDKVIRRLKEKSDSPLSSMKPLEASEDFFIAYNEKIRQMNDVIYDHNAKVASHEQNVQNAKAELEKHLIADAAKAQSFSKTENDYQESVATEDEARRTFEKNDREIKSLEDELSSVHGAIKDINGYLKGFFGMMEIYLEMDEAENGYIIKRDDNIADNISEGEKSAIAFAYFIAKTHEAEFDISKGTIVIDDPISIFDSNFVYYCASLVRDNFENAKQLIISTHHLDFFNRIKSWFKEAAFRNDAEFFMVDNKVLGSKRYASIVRLDETLYRFKSEYHFLFSRLNKLVTEESEYADFYVMGNIARRFLEIYTHFKIPTVQRLDVKLKRLTEGRITASEKDKLSKLINDFSHSSSSASVIQHIDRGEVKGAVEILMKIVRKSDDVHFDCLKQTIHSH